MDRHTRDLLHRCEAEIVRLRQGVRDHVASLPTAVIVRGRLMDLLDLVDPEPEPVLEELRNVLGIGHAVGGEG